MNFLAGATAAGLIIVGCLSNPEEPKSDPNIGDIRLTEIHYHPLDFAGIDGDSLEFIELKNVGSVAVNVGALHCTEGISYDFPNNAEIAVGGFYVIASNKNCFARRYGFSPDGVYSGQLSNSGEKIEITDISSHRVIISQTYSDNGEWPKEADGEGYSLVPINLNPDSNETAPSHWRGSSETGGSPGKDDISKAFDSTLLNLRVTEIQYHPDYTDSIGADSLEFIELKNVGSFTMNLSGVTFTSGISYAFPYGATLQAGAFCVLASNSRWFKARYSFKPFGEYKGQLRNSGDTITITEIKSGKKILSIAYTDHFPWSAYADGKGWSLVTKNPNPALEKQDNSGEWRHSLRLNGSPGCDDPEPVLVNEALTHTDPPLVDAVELYNPNNAAIDLGNWFISDNIDHPTKFRIPSGTTIAAHGYLVFDEHDFNVDPTSATSFRFSEYGEAVYLFADSIGKKGYYHGFTFGPIENGVSFGRYVTSIDTQFVAQSATSLGAENKGPRVGPVVITEIMSNAADSLGNFIEIKNISKSEIPLYEESDTTRTWKISPVGFSFPTSVTLKAGAIALIVQNGVALDSMKSRYSISDSVQLFTMSGRLYSNLDSIIIERPDIDSVSLTMQELPYFQVDRVVFARKESWPSEADGTGKSLQRIDLSTFGNDPKNWKAADPSPGK